MPAGAHGSSLERAFIGTDIISGHSVRLIQLAEKKWRPSGRRRGSSRVGQVGKWTWQESAFDRTGEATGGQGERFREPGEIRQSSRLDS